MKIEVTEEMREALRDIEACDSTLHARGGSREVEHLRDGSALYLARLVAAAVEKEEGR